MNEQPEFEELEHIPWSALAAKTSSPLIRPAAIAVAVVVAVVLVGGLTMRVGSSDSSHPTTSAPGLVPVTADTIEGPVAAVASDELGGLPESSETAVPVLDAGIYSEADLMAIAVDDESRLAAMRAEWFVQDYFTVDGDQEIPTALAGLTESAVALPHTAPAGSSYVEWARTLAIASPIPSEYVVEVAFRTVFSPRGEAFARGPVRAVGVTVTVAADGAMTIEGLPAPAPLPDLAWAADTSGVAATAPDDVVAAAVDSAEAFGVDPVVVDTKRDGSEWHVVLEVGDQSGNRWPIAVSLSDL